MPVPYRQFESDLEKSEAGVREFSRQICARGATKIVLGETSDWDVQWVQNGETCTAELKQDLMAEKTGNVAIEVSSRGKPSGLSTSKATYYVYLIRGDYYMILTTSLRVHISANLYRFVKGGDDNTSELYLIPLHRFCALCRPLFTKVPSYLLSQFK
jgi:hypothetical protein